MQIYIGATGIAVTGLAVTGLAVTGIAVTGIAVTGLAVTGIAVTGIAAGGPAPRTTAAVLGCACAGPWAGAGGGETRAQERVLSGWARIETLTGWSKGPRVLTG